VGSRLARTLGHAFIVAAVAVAGSGSSAQPWATTEVSPLRCPLDGAYDPANPFARIVRGELPVSLVAEDATVMAFIPLGWQHPGHALVVPKRAVRVLSDLNDAEIVAVMRMVKRVAVAQQRAFGSTGYTLEQNNGRHQDVCHAHFHVIPNTPGTSVTRATRGEMDAVSARLRGAMPPP
jgi:histidine triad (HIT) family protein